MVAEDIPAFRVYLLRHARSGWAPPGQTDFDRTLDDTGFGEAEIVAEMAADRGLRPDRVLSSTAARCRQTAEAMRRAMGEDLDIRYVDALYTGPASVYRNMIEAQADVASLMVVGHNPMIEEVLHELAGEAAASTAIPDGYPTGTICIVDFERKPDAAAPVTGKLTGILKPRR